MTDSAVRILHIPTGITSVSQDHRCQHRNKVEAVRRLRLNLACQTTTAHLSRGHASEDGMTDKNNTTSTILRFNDENYGVTRPQSHERWTELQESSVQFLFRKNASKKDPQYYEGVRLLMEQLHNYKGALK